MRSASEVGSAAAECPGRRALLAGMAGFGVVTALPVAAGATPERFTIALRELFGDRPIAEGRIRLELPTIAENGTTVPFSVSVDSPMNATDYVRAIYVFAERNPLPDVARFRFTPRSGRARVSTRIRLAAAQTILAVAEASDGSLWSAQADVVISFAACMDPG